MFLFYWSYMALVWLVLLNCVIAIVNYGYEAAKTREEFLRQTSGFESSLTPVQRLRIGAMKVVIAGNPLPVIYWKTRCGRAAVTFSHLVALLEQPDWPRVRHSREVAVQLAWLCTNKQALMTWNYMQLKLQTRKCGAGGCGLAPPVRRSPPASTPEEASWCPPSERPDVTMPDVLHAATKTVTPENSPAISVPPDPERR